MYEYHCKTCGNRFEELIRNKTDEDSTACPSCGSFDKEKMLSAFAAGGKGSSAGSFAGASCGSGGFS